MNFADLNKDSDYVEVLKYFFEKRVHNNRKYSLRSYARDLGITSSRLSQILQKKYGLSKKAGEEIAEKLKLSLIEKEAFCHLISIKHSRSKKEKDKALDFFKEFGSFYIHLTDVSFKAISDWQYYAVMEMSDLLGDHYSIQEVARRLGLTMKKTREVTRTLIELGYLIQKSPTELVKSGQYHVSSHVQKKDAALKYTSQIVTKLDKNLKHHVDLISSTVLLSMDEKSLAYAKREMTHFCANLNKEIETRYKQVNPQLYYFNAYIFSAEAVPKKSKK